MIPLSKNLWRLSPPRPDVESLLVNELKISPLLARLLVNRGIYSLEGASIFISSRLKDLHNPFLMLGMDRAVERIMKAICSGERIGIYGDYDVDGITASALLYLFFKEIGIDTSVYLPHRLKEGYGMKRGGVERLKDDGVSLIITADCGISSHEEIGFARDKGIDCIITDHHEIPCSLPPAYSILNPRQEGCRFPFKGLCGAGVAFNLVMALRSSLRDGGFFSRGDIPNLRSYLDLVALGTLADIVPLLDENRIFVRFGIKEIEGGRRKGIKALCEVAGLGDGINVGNLSFQIIPRLNAAGRMDDPNLALKLLITDDLEEAVSIAKRLDLLNRERQRVEERMWLDVQREIDGFDDPDRESVICLSSSEWHPGVIGIVASRVVERYNRPAFLIAVKDGEGRGSVRGIKGVNVVESLKSCEDLLCGFGGHRAAAGFKIDEERIGELTSALKAFFETNYCIEDLVPELSLDDMLDVHQLSGDIVRDLCTLEPHGFANPEPVFAVGGVTVVNTRIVGDNHLSLYLKKDRHFYDAIGFRLGDIMEEGAKDTEISLAFTPFIDEWNGRKRLRLKIRDIGEPDKEIKKGFAGGVT